MITSCLKIHLKEQWVTVAGCSWLKYYIYINRPFGRLQDDNLIALTEGLEYELKNMEQGGKQKQVVVQQLLALQRLQPEESPSQMHEQSSGPLSRCLETQSSKHFTREDSHQKTQGLTKDRSLTRLDSHIPKQPFMDQSLFSDTPQLRSRNDQVYPTLVLLSKCL